MQKPYFQWQGQDLLLFCHIQPDASKNEFAGLYGDRLKIRIKAPSIDGKANATLVEFMSEQFVVPKNQIRIEQGDLGRRKTIRIVGSRQIPRNLLHNN